MARFKDNIGKINGKTNSLNMASERKLIQYYKNSLKDIRMQMAEVYSKYSKNGVLTYAEMAKYGRLNSLEAEISVQLKALTGKTAAEIKRLQSTVYSESYYRTAFAIEFAAQAKLRYVLLNESAIEASVQNPISGLTLNNRLKKNRIDIISKTKQEITQGLIKGESYEKIAQRLKDVYENDLVKTRRIVRTESHRNQSQGTLDSLYHAKEGGVKTMKVWQATFDSKTRDSHDSMNGQKVEVNENFIFNSGDNAGEEVEAPGLSGIAEEDINCRCVLMEEIVGYAPGVEGNNEDEIAGNYDDWKDEKGF